MLLPLLFYFRLFNNPYSVILREGYSFPDFNSEFISEFVMFTSFFFTFELFIYFMWRRGPDNLVPVKGSLGVGDTRGIKLGYFNNQEGK